MKYSDVLVLNSKQLAEKLNVSPSFLTSLRIRGDGPKYIRMGHAVRYFWSDVEEYLENSRRKSTSEYVK
jgi:predicted DNA-binding transcriptional regulator AlpA